jgi:hypothetical protein
MLPLTVDIAIRDSKARIEDGEPACFDRAVAGAATPLPVLGAVPAGGPRLKGDASRMRRISLDGMVAHQDAVQPKALLAAEPIETGRLLPSLKLRPAKDRPSLDLERRLTAPIWRKLVFRAGDFSKNMPGIAKAGGLLLALLLVAVFFGVPGTNRGSSGDVQATLSGGWEHVQRNILERAAVALTDDFRAGLADWEGQEDWARSWSYDQSGFVRTGPLALYTPSLALANYRMEFLGQIEKKSLGWVVRAADARNYYAVKLTVTNPGPVPEVSIQRYPVIDGQPGPVRRKRLPVQVQMDTLYRIQMDLRNNDFALSVQGNMVDTWSEPRLPRGGVGFFSSK